MNGFLERLRGLFAPAANRPGNVYARDERLLTRLTDSPQKAAALAALQNPDELVRRWQILSAREQQVTALTCLRYTNQDISAFLHISVDTVKTHMRNILFKFDLHSKRELRLALGEWDFSEFEPRMDGG